MSETDDTDDLLLIPPDFFVQEAELDLQPPYIGVFDSIIKQVNKLEDRLDHIESASDLSLANGSMADERYMYSKDDRYIGLDSTQSTPQKPKTKFKLNSLPSSPSSDRYSSRRPRTSLFAPGNIIRTHQDIAELNNEPHTDSSLSRPKSAVLSEIDEFISNVKTIERINKGKQYDAARKRLDRDDISKLIQKLEKEQEQEKAQQTKTWKCGENINTVPDGDSGMKYILYKDRDQSENTSSFLPKRLQKSVTNTESYITEEIQSATSSEDTRTTAIHYVKSAPEISQIPSGTENFIRENKVTFTYKNDVKQNFPGSSAGDAARSSIPSVESLKLLSLRDLWGQKKEAREFSTGDGTRLHQKLEEEKLRRQHCELLIQSLQTKTLELQERLAVALEVDEAKDEAIVKFHEAWENVANRLEVAEKEKSELKAEMESLIIKNQQELQDAFTKIAHYEEEVSKALNIAHNAQQKLSCLETQCNNFNTEREDLENQFHILQDKLDAEVQKSKQLTEMMAQKDAELNENKNVLSSARKEVAQSKRAVEVCQQEFASLKSECALLQVQVAEKHKRITDLEVQRKKLLTDVDARKKNEENLQDELQKFRNNMEQHKIELRNFYQNQVETVVREKLREFQSQLDRAEGLLQEEVKNKELSIARTAALHIQSISEKHALEVHLLEEKHKEEVRLYQVQLSQNEQQIQNMQAKFQQQHERKSQLAQQLHKVMEAQWLEALKIINNSKSPVLPNSKDFSTIDQLNSLRSKSQLDFEELLNANESKIVKPEGQHTISKGGIDNVESFSSLVEEEKRFSAFNDDFQQKSQKNKRQTEQELQKYIQMLLNKSGVQQEEQKGSEKNSSENAPEQRASWQSQDESRGSRASSKDRKLGKPPWK